jgi:hypothetical protein
MRVCAGRSREIVGIKEMWPRLQLPHDAALVEI